MCEIVTQDLGVKRVVAKFIPRLLLPEQKEHRAAVADDLIQTSTNEPDFLQRVVTEVDGSITVLCTVFLVSSSINVSTSSSAWLDIFWTDFVHVSMSPIHR